MKSKFKKTIDILSTVALSAFVLLVILLAGVRLLGIEPHIVLSGSMEPEIMTGSLVYVKHITPDEAQSLEVGDTVTFLIDSKGTKSTHKIYEVVGPAYLKNQHGEYVLDENGQPIVARDDLGNPIIMYTTYSVNNKNSSSPTGYTLDGELGVGNLGSSNVIGKPCFSIPLLGYVASFVQTPTGRYATVILCILLTAASLFGGSSPKKRNAAANHPKQETTSEEQPPTEDKHTG